MSLTKYWGDERQSDAIYAVYLKKVRYVQPQKHKDLPHYQPIDSDNHYLNGKSDDLDHLQWETIRQRVIKAGTLERLVKSLVNADDYYMDSRQFNVFFATYRAFANTESVLNHFIDWFISITNNLKNEENLAKKKIYQILLNTIRSILICWLDMYSEDFYSSENKFFLLNQLIEFGKNNYLNDLKHKAKKLREHFKRIAEEGGLMAQIPTIKRYSYFGAIRCDPKDYRFARERALLFDVRRENCYQIAEQLTFWDAVLFRELKSYQCQGAIWGKRHKKSADLVYSVRATIDQFNAVSQRVMTSVVFPDSSEFRAKVIEKWITIAGELRALKNFSSLKAVLSSLQSEPVYRLKSTWVLVSKTLMVQFKELSAIFDTDENGEESKARMILEAEGTAKSSPLRRAAISQHCRRTKSDVNLVESQGTVPFLGTFLTDLSMIDQAHYDTTPEGFINFEKHRREFEVLAKIKLFQSAARAYTIAMDHAFCIWFYYLPSINENECFTRSLEVEPMLISATDSRRLISKNDTLVNGLYSPLKFHSLTKIFTHMAINDHYNENETLAQSSLKRQKAQQRSQSGPRQNNYNNNSHTNHKRAESLEHQKKHKIMTIPSTIVQFSNDSGIHTEETGLEKNYADSISTSAIDFKNNKNLHTHLNKNIQNYTEKQNLHSTEDSNKKKTSLSICINKSKKLCSNAENNTLTKKFDNQFSSLSSYRKSPNVYFKTNSKNLLNASFSTVAHKKLLATKSYQNEVETSNDFVASQSANKTNNEMSHLSSIYQFQINNKQNVLHKSISSTSSCSSYGSMASSLTNNGSNGGSFLNGKTNGNDLSSYTSFQTKDFHLIRVGLDNSIQNEKTEASCINYKCIKIENGDKMSSLIEKALEKHMIDINEKLNYCLVQLLPDGNELKLPDNCNPFYAVAPDPTSPMLNFLLKKQNLNLTPGVASDNSSIHAPPSTKKLNRQKRSNLLRWSSGFL